MGIAAPKLTTIGAQSRGHMMSQSAASKSLAKINVGALEVDKSVSCSDAVGMKTFLFGLSHTPRTSVFSWLSLFSLQQCH